MTFTGCGACGADPIEDCRCFTELKVNDAARAAAHRELDRWIDYAERSATDSHVAGYPERISDFTLRATGEDREVVLHVARSALEPLP